MHSADTAGTHFAVVCPSRGFITKGDTLYASPGGAALEGRLSWTLRLVVLVPELVVEGLLVAV